MKYGAVDFLVLLIAKVQRTALPRMDTLHNRRDHFQFWESRGVEPKVHISLDRTNRKSTVDGFVVLAYFPTYSPSIRDRDALLDPLTIDEGRRLVLHRILVRSDYIPWVVLHPQQVMFSWKRAPPGTELRTIQAKAGCRHIQTEAW